MDVGLEAKREIGERQKLNNQMPDTHRGKQTRLPEALWFKQIGLRRRSPENKRGSQFDCPSMAFALRISLETYVPDSAGIVIFCPI
jgi:hypothetical protein